MFLKGLLGSPIALVGGKEKQFTLPLPNAVVCDNESGENYGYGGEGGEWKVIQFPKGKWQAKEMTFTRVREKP